MLPGAHTQQSSPTLCRAAACSDELFRHTGRGEHTCPDGAISGSEITLTYRLESLEKEKQCMPAVWPFNSKALITSRKSPLLPKHTSHTFTSGVKPHDATNLGRRKSETGYLLQICYKFGWAMELYSHSHSHTELSSSLLREAEATCSPTGCLAEERIRKGSVKSILSGHLHSELCFDLLKKFSLED